MRILSKEELQTLATEYDGLCVSIFMPTYRAGAETQQNPIRFKNLLTKAEARLVEAGMHTTEAEAHLAPAQRLLQDNLFWQYQSDGLAVFLAEGGLRSYRVPLRLDELVVVANRFHIKPLMPLLSGDGQFYVLALSQKEIRLLQGTRDSVEEVDLEDVPESIDEALWFEDPERHLQFHTATGTPGRGGRPAVFHGHGVSTETDDKELILRYFHRVDKGLRALLGEADAPLVLAGVDYLLPIYREANTYPHLAEQGITGNPETLSAAELHAHAWSILEPHFMEAQKEAAAQYHNLTNTGRATADIEAIVPAAYHGRVDTLFVAVDRQRWGVFDKAKNAVQLQQNPDPGSADVLDLAAVQTLLNGGMVYALRAEDVPEDGAAMAAIYRY